MRTVPRKNPDGQQGMTLIALLGIMAVFAAALLVAAPAVYTEIQREKELEAIRRGEEVAEAIRQYIEFYGGGKLPSSMDDLLEGLPAGTKRRQILRPSAAVDPLSEDGRWRLIKPDPNSIGPFARRVQIYNGGLLPANPSPIFDKFAATFISVLNTELDSDDDPVSVFDSDFDNTPFIGVASQSRARSIITYYGIDNHSKWVFTPLFRGSGRNATQSPQVNQPPPVRQ